jgi:hypothetical protein
MTRLDVDRVFRKLERKAQLFTIMVEIMADQLQEFTDKLAAAKEAVRQDESDDDAREAADEAEKQALQAIIADLKAHPAAPDLTPQITALDELLALLHPPVPGAGTGTGT